MEMPKNVLMEQLTNLVEVLSNKLTGATFQEIKAINPGISDKGAEAAVYVGLVKRQGEKYLVAENGKKFYQAQDQRAKNESIRELLKKIDIYNLTTEYLHHNKIEKPTKLDVGSYWNEHFSLIIKGYTEDDLTSSVIFFFRFLELASLGKFINAGRGRETRIDMDMVELAKFVTSSVEIPETKATDKKSEIKPATELSKAQSKSSVDDGNIEGSLSVLKKLNPELIWSDLDSDGAKKLIIDKINDISKQNVVLNAKVEEYQKLQSVNAVLSEKVHNLKIDNLFRASVNSIGGVVLGVSLTLSGTIYQVCGAIMGAILIILSIFLKQREASKVEE